ncbi:MAG TPA: HAD family hydrolase [Candidatus Limnocylindrales bacterium]|nr:HAD family hydrolase [Candidatus Limnocylindrales bacterium]
MTFPYDVVTFDCYGTLIDWETGLREAFVAAAGFAGPVDLDRAVALYLEIERVVEHEPYQSYRGVVTETTRRVAARLGWRLPDARAGFVADSIPGWRPFRDTNPALRRLTDAGYTLGILSNVDDDVLAWTRRHFTAKFEVVVSAEDVGSYKPAHAHFVRAHEIIREIEANARAGRPGPPVARLGPDGLRWLHAAQSYFHDVEPARALGIPVAWINRKGQTPAGAARPNAEFRTLEGLATWLTENP